MFLLFNQVLRRALKKKQVINGASDLMVEVFGEAGRHARSAVGSVSLPLNVATEVEAVIELEDFVRYFIQETEMSLNDLSVSVNMLVIFSYCVVLL